MIKRAVVCLLTWFVFVPVCVPLALIERWLRQFLDWADLLAWRMERWSQR